MMNYLGQRIDLLEESSGWVGIWWHRMGLIEIGFFPTSNEAENAVIELIKRDFAVRLLIEIVQQWRNNDLINEREYTASVDVMIKFVLQGHK